MKYLQFIQPLILQNPKYQDNKNHDATDRTQNHRKRRAFLHDISLEVKLNLGASSAVQIIKRILEILRATPIPTGTESGTSKKHESSL